MLQPNSNEMKQNYFLLIIFVFLPSLIFSQASITINGTSSAEIGESYNFNFSIDPNYPPLAVEYRVTHWHVSVSNINSGDIPGLLAEETQPYYDTFNIEKDLSIAIQWGSSVSSDYSYVQASAQGEYLDEDGFPIGTFDTGHLSSNSETITMRRICVPLINYDNNTDCAIEEIDIDASEYCYADNFSWSLSRGTILSGQGTSSITVETPRSGDFQATLVLGRSSADPNYKKTKTINIERDSPSAALEVLYESYTEPTYLCKYSGQEFGIQDNENIQDITWTAPNSTISSESIRDGKRTVTVIPNSSVSNGSTENVSAIINYIGGCSYNTNTKTFTVSEAETPPTPSGYLYMDPINGNACENEGYEVIFVASNPYDNGKTSLSRTILPPHAGSAPQSITVCYTNFCSMEQTCKTMTAYPPSPCDGGPKPGTLSMVEENIVIAPNPTKGNFKIEFQSKLEGSYQLFNSNGEMIKNGTFNKQILNITFAPSSKNGQYFVRVITDEIQFTNQIILKR